MPVYVYACASCRHGFETRQGFNDAPLTICPECGGKIRRVVQPVGIVFKGSGFYKNDSRSTTEAAVPAGERKPEAATAGEAATGAAPSPAPANNASTPASSPPAPAASGESKSKPAPAAPASGA
jgi:putative FmdB family regulatory protein